MMNLNSKAAIETQFDYRVRGTNMFHDMELVM